METCCLIVVVAVIGLIIYSISSSVSEKNAEREKKIKNYKNARITFRNQVIFFYHFILIVIYFY